MTFQSTRELNVSALAFWSRDRTILGKKNLALMDQLRAEA